MPESRKRPGHPFQKEAAIPVKQRVKGRVFWAILFAIFAGLISFFAAGSNYVVLAIVVFIGGIIGYMVGKRMEKDAKS